MKNLTIFKFLSVSLLMCPLFSPAMEMPRSEAKISDMLVSIANQSEQPVYAYVVDDVMTIQPDEDTDDFVIPLERFPGIQTENGIYTLGLDNKKYPTSFILVLHKNGKDSNVQKIPYNEVNNIIFIVNPDASVTVAQGNPVHAAEKIQATQVGKKIQYPAEKIQSNAQVVINPRANISSFAIDRITDYDRSIKRTFSAVISFNQPPSRTFMGEFINNLQQSLQGPIEIQIRPDGKSLSITGNTALKQVDLQKVVNFLNDLFGHQQ
ncbi:MAG TPA: hypothetical protein VJ201_04510 [Candidatus Babeliales bacterium]|nr:hypothetical protein [Candidatus Babeliales bacterium]